MLSQVDNQLPNAFENIVLFPTVLPKDEKEARPVLMASIAKSKDKTYGVEYYEWLTILLQELSLEVDEEFLNNLLDFGKSFHTLTEEEASLIPKQTAVAKQKSLDEEEILYFDRLLLHPIQVNISFTKTISSKKQVVREDRPGYSGMIAFAFDILTMTIGNIHDAPIRLNALELQHANGHFEQLANLIIRFYSQEAVGQLHKVVGSADVLGNPVKLFSTVSSGVSDLFYEPLQGFEITRPQDFGIGVMKGASSLVKKTVFGLSDTVARFTGSVSKGLSVITMDEKVRQHHFFVPR